MVQPAQRMPSAAAVRASPSVRDGLAYPNSEPPLFKNVGDLLPVGIADDEGPQVGLVDGPGRREAALMQSAGRQRPVARSSKISAQKTMDTQPRQNAAAASIAAKPAAHATTAAASRTPCSLSLITLAISDQRARENASPKSIVNAFTSLRSAAMMQTKMRPPSRGGSGKRLNTPSTLMIKHGSSGGGQHHVASRAAERPKIDRYRFGIAQEERRTHQQQNARQ